MRDSGLAEYLDHDPFPEPPRQRSATCERDQFQSDVVRMVMEIFPGARWTTKDEYRRRAQRRDRKVWKKRA
jgi:hypothetical protein